ncbi:MAG: hypothetical protein IIZ35_01980 [Clostridia bacterium]|nr:hypothetical protein [Clostridia bacterium]
MVFPSVNGAKRPVRCSEATRLFAYESLGHKYGLEAKKTPSVTLTGAFDDPLKRYDAAIRTIAEQAPVRICEGELISGSASLGDAIRHVVPCEYGGAPVFESVSHLTVDFFTAVNEGLDSVREKALAAAEKYEGTDREPFAKSCISVLDSFDIWHKRYLDALRDRPGYRKNCEALERVPHKPARSFREAVSSLWFCFAFLRLCGNWPGLGRIDVLLGPYLENDLESGALTLGEAREILAHFFIKGCEWICGGNYGSGDAQHYQNIVISGVDEEGRDVTNEVTYLILDIIEEFGISDFPTTVRLNASSDEKLVRRVAEVMRYGGGVLAVYNEDLVIDSLVSYGYPVDDARRFANDGCWEVQIPGKTFFRYIPFDAFGLLQHETLKDYSPGVDFEDFESLYRAYIGDLGAFLDGLCREVGGRFVSSDPWTWAPDRPCTAVSLFEEGCIEKGLSYLEGGPVYNVVSPHLGGLADTVNGLYAIKRLVFEEKKLTLGEFAAVLRDDWEGNEPLRRYVMNKYEYYGNDSDEADGLCRRLLSDFADICSTLDGRNGYRFPGGVSTFGRQLEWAPRRLAAPHGRKKGTVLAANASPTPGTDLQGETAAIRSYCKNDLSRLPVGAALDLKLLPSSVTGEDGLSALVSLLRGFVTLGGFFIQPDVVDAAVLREAQKHPEDYQNLSVRVSGWNTRFVTLNTEWQNMVIEQNECGGC